MATISGELEGIETWIGEEIFGLGFQGLLSSKFPVALVFKNELEKKNNINIIKHYNQIFKWKQCDYGANISVIVNSYTRINVNNFHYIIAKRKKLW